ncbi:hypothetical protein V8C86DRAFT_2727884, partial [Haematococcus lacustris]
PACCCLPASLCLLLPCCNWLTGWGQRSLARGHHMRPTHETHTLLLMAPACAPGVLLQLKQRLAFAGGLVHCLPS